jgi:hypothetical protein
LLGYGVIAVSLNASRLAGDDMTVSASRFLVVADVKTISDLAAFETFLKESSPDYVMW